MNGRTIHVLPHQALAEFKQLAEGIADADRRARTNHGDPKDYTYDPNPPKPSEPKKCPDCGSKHQFGRVYKNRHDPKYYHCGRCDRLFLYRKDWSLIA